VARGAPEVDSAGRIVVHADDAARVRKAIRPASRLKDKSPAFQQGELRRIFGRIPSEPPRRLPQALRIETAHFDPAAVPMPQPPGRGSPRLIGWKPSSAKSDLADTDVAGAQVTIERRGDAFLIAGSGLDPIEAYTKSDVTDAVVTFLRAREPNGAVSLDLRNFQHQEATGLIRECEVQLAAEGRPRAIAGLLRSEKLDNAVLTRLRATRYDFSRATVKSSVIETATHAEGRVTVDIPRVGSNVSARSSLRVSFSKSTPKSVVNRIMSMLSTAIERVLVQMRGSYDALVFNFRLNQAVKRIRQETGVDFTLIEQQFIESSTDLRIVSSDGGVHEVSSTSASRAA
jgi:hypothetical protein